MLDLDSFCVPPSASVRETMERISEGRRGIALVVDRDGHFLHTVTDGDVRRAILDGVSLEASIESALARVPRRPPTTASSNASDQQLRQMMAEHKLRHVPILNDEGRLVRLATIDELIEESELPIRAVVMAGGFGKRLRPLTEDTPKPMLPLGGKPLLERIVQKLQNSGVRNLSITTHFKPEKIIDHFGDGQRFGLSVNYLNEEEPLGTAGALSMIEPQDDPLLVMNGDIFTEIDFRAMLEFHHEHLADLTICVRQYEVQVPFGVLECEGAFVKGMTEKPSVGFFVNAGVYLIGPKAHALIPRRTSYNMNELVEACLAKGMKVVSFPIVDIWLDIGRHEDYDQAQRLASTEGESP